ncbi:ribonuclease H-like domain-containing protein [Tanacetum coccineum]
MLLPWLTWGLLIGRGLSINRYVYSTLIKDLEQLNHDNLEEMDIKWQVLIKLRLNALTVIEEAILPGNVEHQEIKGTRMEMQGIGAGTTPEGLKNEVVYEEKIAVLEFEVKDKGNGVTRLTNQLEQTLKEKEDLKAKLAQFETSSKNLTKLINSQISSKDKTGLGYGDQLIENDSSSSGLFNSVFDSRSSDEDDNQTNDRFKKDNEYHAVPPPLTGNYMPPLADLSFIGLDDSVYRPTTNKTSASVSQVETSNTPPSNTSVEMPRVESVRPSGVIIKYWVSDDDEDIFQFEYSQTTVKPSFKKIKFTKARNEPVKSDKQVVKPRMKMAKKSVLKNIGKGTGHREVRPIWNNTQRINHQNKFVPTAVLTRVSKEKVNTVRVNGVNTAGQTAVSTIKGNGVTAGNLQQALKYKGMFDSGCSRHMTGNKALLTDYQDIDGGFVAFGGSTRGGKITCIGKIRTNKIDFEDVFFVKELKFNLFSVSQMCDKKNSILFIETECLVLSPDFKLIDKSQVLLRVPRQNNMYSFNLKNIVPSGDLTCLFAKATIDESRLWHRRLGHVNFKTINKLVKGNLVRGQGPNWLSDIDSLTNSMNYQPVTARNQTNKNTGPQEANGNTDENDTADDSAGESPVQKPASENEQALKNVLDKMMDQEKEATKQSDAVRKEFEAQCNRELFQGKATKASSTNSFNTVSTPVNAASASRTSNDAGPSSVPLGRSFPLNVNDLPDDPLMPDLEDTAEVQNTGIFGSAYDDEDLDTYNSLYADQVMSAEADFNNMEPSTVGSPIPSTRVYSIHPKDQIIGDPRSAVQTKGMTKKSSREHAMISYIKKQRRTNHKDLQNYLFACFLSQQEPTKYLINSDHTF